MPICPRGHESQAEDWCDFCGFPMTPPPPIPPPPGTLPGAHGIPGTPGGHAAPGGYGSHGSHSSHGAPGGHGGAPFGGPVAPGAVPPPATQGYPELTEGLVVCPICRSPQTGRFCEECGYDYDLSAPSHRQPTADGGIPGQAAGPAPLNIPAAYGGSPQPGGQGQQQPAPHQQPQHGQLSHAQPQHGQPQHSQHQHGQHQQAQHQPQSQQPPQPQHPQGPHGGAPSGYGYPPPQPANGQQAPAPAPAHGSPYQENPPREDSGPVYAQPGPTGRGEEFGTSFNLAPPVPPQVQQAPPQAQQQPPLGHPGQPGHPGRPEPVRSNWLAVVSADRDYFTDMMARSGPEAAGLFFPPYCPERRIPITGRGQLRIGRRSQHRGTVPEIDLSVPPEDPGASHQHALLAEQADGSWVLVDQDSTNGTTVNGGAEPIAPHTAIPLNDGDRIHIGAWTTITLHRA
ncbi:FHA domain-containing protein [Kitasatospora sp. NPDC088351]|uniref:FHA domain-containing protein n=1 Tax=Kitasatospora sp. NPDC088351 TaxID=3155180 RepID=UPI003423F3B3